MNLHEHYIKMMSLICCRRLIKGKIISDDCIKCKTCVRNCPADAINIESKSFDLDKCIGCWACINRCPKHAIKSTSREMNDIMINFSSAFE